MKLVRSFFKSIISVVIISAFVVLVAFFIKGVSSLDDKKVMEIASSVASKVGLPEEKIGDVAGAVTKRVMDTSFSKAAPSGLPNTPTQPNSANAKVLSIAIFGEIHNDLAGLTVATNIAKEKNADAFFLLGDNTDLGTISELTDVQKILVESGIPFYILPGDHDLYESVGPDNFISLFSQPNRAFMLGKYKFVFLDNSANHTLIAENFVNWFAREVDGADFVFLSQPVFVPNVSVFTPMMGYVNGEKDEPVFAQASQLLAMLQTSGAKLVFASDHHKSSLSVDPVNKELVHAVVGAINPSKRFQSARFSLLDIFENGDYNIEEIELD